MSYKASIRTYGDPKYYDNVVRFATRKEADDYGKDLSWRWTQAEAYKVSKSTDPVNYQMVGGELKRIEGNPYRSTLVGTGHRFIDGREYRILIRGVPEKYARREAKRWLRDGFSVKVVGSDRLGWDVLVWRNDIGTVPNPDSHTQVSVPKLPKCDFCDERALYDGKTTVGPWGFMCRKHFREYGTGLGLGRGQKLIPKRNPSSGYTPCRCCGKPVPVWLDAPIHTKCIPKHWGKHAHGINASRCHEFGKRTR